MADSIDATFRLAMMRARHPDLSHALAKANVDLAAAIIAMDAAEGEPGRHSMFEQVAVDEAKTRYAQALANLLRGEGEHVVYEGFAANQAAWVEDAWAAYERGDEAHFSKKRLTHQSDDLDPKENES